MVVVFVVVVAFVGGGVMYVLVVHVVVLVGVFVYVLVCILVDVLVDVLLMFVGVLMLEGVSVGAFVYVLEGVFVHTWMGEAVHGDCVVGVFVCEMVTLYTVDEMKVCV